MAEAVAAEAEAVAAEAEATAEAAGEAGTQKSEERANTTELHPSVHVVSSAKEARRVATLLIDLAKQDPALLFAAETGVRSDSVTSFLAAA